MAGVIGFGGVFFKARDPEALGAWYAKHLKIQLAGFGGAKFLEDSARPGCIVWTPFKETTNYFAPSDKPFMINFRVDDLHALLAELRGAGVQVDARVDESDFGRFGWIMDPEGNRVELWEPPAKA
ncbi:MAG TPA: VOC family protein [Rudaea sp.]|nr:VOC family protein [Rudaea sp.]